VLSARPRDAYARRNGQVEALAVGV
jgi:hypothetical protein